MFLVSLTFLMYMRNKQYKPAEPPSKRKSTSNDLFCRERDAKSSDNGMTKNVLYERDI